MVRLFNGLYLWEAYRMKLIDGSKKYYKGNLHLHTNCSDGQRTPEEAIQEYSEHGYDFIAITDHWKVGAERHADGLLVLPGVEYDFTFPTQVLHVVALFLDQKSGEGIVRGMSHEEIINRINECGGVAVAAHPAWSLNTPDFLLGLNGVEISEIYNTLSDEPINARRGDSASVLDVTAANGKLYRQIATDDTHFYIGEQCRSYTMVQADELSVPSILEALKAGRFYASQGPEFLDVEFDGKTLTVRTSPVSVCTFSSNKYWVAGRCRTGENMTENVYEIQPGETFIRCEITDAQGRRAWLSPIAIS